MLFHGTFGKLYRNDERYTNYSHDIIYALIIGFILYVSSHAYIATVGLSKIYLKQNTSVMHWYYIELDKLVQHNLSLSLMTALKVCFTLLLEYIQ